MKQTQDLTITIQKEVSPIVQKATSLIITAKTIPEATEMISQLNISLKKIKEEKDKVLKPLLEATKAERARWEVLEGNLNSAVLALRTSLSNYQTEALRLAKIEEDKIASRIKEGKGNLTLETASKKLAMIDTPAAKTETQSGTLKFRPMQQLKIINIALIPREYMLPDEKLILADLKAGQQVKGAMLETIQIPINTRS